MKYVIIPKENLSPTQLAKAGVRDINQAITNADGTAVLLKFLDEDADHFSGYKHYSIEDIRKEKSKAEWTGNSWMDSLLQLFGFGA